ncbi:MAG: hypothetical protein JWL64_2597 [Frankiales bacterium]|nr:hypothetical protein [Frankiales bacterium]
MRRRVLALLVAVLVLAALLVTAAVTRPDRAAPADASAVERVPVVGATAVCPDLRQDRGITTSVSVGAVPGVVGDRTPGQLTAGALGAAGPPPPLPVAEAGQVLAGLGAGVALDAFVATARGPLAAGLEVEQLGRGQGVERGLLGMRCGSPATDQWLIGGATTAGNDALLILVNTDATPAVVDVQLLHDLGASDPRPGRGLVVPAHGRLLVSLNLLAPDRTDIATHVVATRGRVAAGVLHRKVDGAIPQGIDWAARSPGPAPVVIVPGLPSGPGSRQVIVTNPNDQSLRASVQVTTEDGQFVPPGLEAVEIPAGTSVAVDLSEPLAETSGAVRITSDGGPVVAAGVVVAQWSPVQEFSYTSSGVALDGPALLTEVTLDRQSQHYLLLSAPEGDAAVTVTAFPTLGATLARLAAPKTLRVAGGTTQVLALATFLPPGSQARLAVEVRPDPGAGPVYASAYLSSPDAAGPRETMLTLRSAAQEVERPAVLADPAADRR